MKTIIEMHTVDEKYIEDEFCEHEFRVKIRHMKIIELRAELEAKRALLAMKTIMEMHTVDDKYVKDGFCAHEFQEKIRHMKIIELRAELEAKRALLDALIREQQVYHERDREVMCSDCMCGTRKKERGRDGADGSGRASEEQQASGQH
jgi:hypothetical protein